MTSLTNLGSNDVVQLALGAVGGFAVNQIANSQPVLNSPIIPLTGMVSLTKADALTGGLGLAAAGTGYVLKQKTFVNLGAGAVVGTVISKMASAAGFNLQNHVTSAVSQARAIWDRTFTPSQAYASAPQGNLRKMTPRDIRAQNDGRANSFLYSFTPTSNGGSYRANELSRSVNSKISYADFSYT
ncbi:hypothetical protein NTE_02534 [Candidatus Nitrososphaera evergladensis SR1]|uniref:Uncharacterized protein n=1 Tax=Candidatus Nitrososphaera evergladensis SR1 TaxID=1459636 RepID=A0A075MSM8_9ARCH|nr:hypothetical protein [Candidatus Nitrososphaera evergladensis]AIF84581.1 hypothetical protein NTE_02534 [Candidatus Nitrososphaera evergladensis SR1]